MTKFKDVVAIISTCIAIIAGFISLSEKFRIETLKIDLSPYTLLIITALLLSVTIWLQWDKFKTKFTGGSRKLADINPIIIMLCLFVALVIIFISIQSAKQHSEMLVSNAKIYDSLKRKDDSLLRKIEILAAMNNTKFVGMFPENMKEITKLISTAKEDLIIAVDYPAYGAYSDPSAFLSYSQAIQNRRSEHKSVQMLIYDSSQATKSSEEQLDDNGWAERQVSNQFRTYYDHFHEGKSKPSSNKEFLADLNNENEEFKRDLKNRNVQIQHISQTLPVFVWATNDEAIFSFYNLGKESREYTFYTNDRFLIEILRQMYQKYLPIRDRNSQDPS